MGEGVDERDVVHKRRKGSDGVGPDIVELCDELLRGLQIFHRHQYSALLECTHEVELQAGTDLFGNDGGGKGQRLVGQKVAIIGG